MNEFPAFVTMAFSRIIAIFRTRSAFRKFQFLSDKYSKQDETHKQTRERFRLKVKYVLQCSHFQ